LIIYFGNHTLFTFGNWKERVPDTEKAGRRLEEERERIDGRLKRKANEAASSGTQPRQR
jgi:hypothetical protein